MISKKIILTGSFGVGKTSLFNQFLHKKFSEKYLTTIGVKVERKQITVDDKVVSLLLWDIAGEVSQNKVPRSYFLGASGIIYVFDLTRPSTYLNLVSDLEYLQNLLPGVIIKVVGNKIDLITEEQLAKVTNDLPVPYDILTSAKTGAKVEELFQSLGKDLISQKATQV